MADSGPNFYTGGRWMVITDRMRRGQLDQNAEVKFGMQKRRNSKRWI
jgi:hypothetical protein